MLDVNSETFSLIKWVISIIVPALAGLIGVIIGAWLISKQQKSQRKHAFIEKQLKDFYAPLLGVRSEIQMLSELREKISQSADTQWRKLCEEARQSGDEALQDMKKEFQDRYEKLINYDNRQLIESLLPSYRRMATIFKENYYLAEFETRKYFRTLLEFVDLWDRWLDRSIPHEVLKDIDHGEKALHPFYEDLQLRHDELRAKLVNGNV